MVVHGDRMRRVPPRDMGTEPWSLGTYSVSRLVEAGETHQSRVCFQVM